MRISATVHFQAAAGAVWKLLVTPERLSQCTPGLEAWTELDPAREFELLLRWQLTNNNAVRIPVTIIWETLRPPTEMDITLRASMGSQQIDGRGSMQISAETPTTSILTFTLELNTPNKMTLQMVQNLAPRFIDTFFKCLKAQLESANEV